MNRSVGGLSLALFAAAAAVLAVGAVRPAAFDGVRRTVPDFGAYYAAARVNLAGHDPYDLGPLTAVEREIDPDTGPLRAQGPPWAVGATVPLAAFSYGAARVSWFLLNLGLLTAGGGALWHLYGGDDRRAAFGPLLAVAGYPAIQALGLGQFSPLVLAGLVGFVTLERAGRPLLAGLPLALLLMKPQTQLVTAAVGTLWLVDRREWRVALGAAVGTGALTLLVAVPNPAVFGQYIESLRSDPPAGVWRPPLPGTVLRLVFGWDRFVLTFAPLLPGLVWGAWLYRRHRRAWDWADRMPLVVLASYLSSPYGWAYDHLVFLFPVIQITAGLSRRPGGAGVLLAVVSWAGLVGYYRLMLGWAADEFHWVWVAPAFTAGYVGWRLTSCRRQVSPV